MCELQWCSENNRYSMSKKAWLCGSKTTAEYKHRDLCQRHKEHNIAPKHFYQSKHTIQINIHNDHRCYEKRRKNQALLQSNWTTYKRKIICRLSTLKALNHQNYPHFTNCSFRFYVNSPWTFPPQTTSPQGHFPPGQLPPDLFHPKRVPTRTTPSWTIPSQTNLCRLVLSRIVPLKKL